MNRNSSVCIHPGHSLKHQWGHHSLPITKSAPPEISTPLWVIVIRLLELNYAAALPHKGPNTSPKPVEAWRVSNLLQQSIYITAMYKNTEHTVCLSVTKGRCQVWHFTYANNLCHHQNWLRGTTFPELLSLIDSIINNYKELVINVTKHWVTCMYTLFLVDKRIYLCCQ